MTVTRDRPNRILRLGQTAYISSFRLDFSMWECSEAVTPLGTEKFHQAPDDYEAPAVFKKQYQFAVGSLMYAIPGTRPDLAFAVSVVSRYRSNPTKAH